MVGAFQGQLAQFPLLILQMIALMGVFALTLMSMRGFNPYKPLNKIWYGIVMGISGYFMTALVAQFIMVPVKPYIRVELLFIVGVLGGWPGGLIAFALTFLARVQFGGANLALISAFEGICYVAAGVLVHRWALRRNLLIIRWQDILLLTVAKSGIGYVVALLMHIFWPDQITIPVLLSVIFSYTVKIPIFMGMLYILLLVIKVDAQQQNYRALQLQQMDAKVQGMFDRTQLFMEISHGLKTPITRLMLRTEMLEDSQQQQSFAEDLDELQNMVGSALDSLRNGEPHENAAVVRLDKMVERLAKRPIYLRAQVETELEVASIWARPRAIERAVGNIIDNGILYGGRVLIMSFLKAGFVHLLVRDFGRGIPEADFDRVFDPHVRLNNGREVNENGTGLGLGISRNIIRSHGGLIFLRNHPEGGLEVEIRLPKAA